MRKKELSILLLAGFLGFSISDLVQGEFRPLKFLYWIVGVAVIGAIYFIFIVVLIKLSSKDKKHNDPS